MDHASSYLFAGEEVALVVRPHAITLVKPGLAPLAAIALITAVPNRFTFTAMLIVFGRFGWDVAQWWFDRYILTSDRIISMSGVFTKKVVSLPLGKITDLTYARSLLGRVLGYGSLDLESAGQKDFGKVDYLPDPDHFYRAVMSLALGQRPEGELPADPGQHPDEQHHHEVDVRDHDSPIVSRLNPDRDPANTDEIPAIRRSDD